MRTLSLSILAAGIALLPMAASAQPGPHGGPPPGATWHGGGMVGMPAHGPNMMIHHMGPGQMGPGMHGMHPGPNFHHGRLQRGFVINPFWFGSQFQINNWQMYGFSDPGPDGRWVRYYDDAYLIDHDGRVRDSRYGMDWDRYGEEWGDDDGIPAYRGGGDDEDYAWDEGQGGRGDDRDGHRREMHMRMRGPGGPMHGPGGGYAYGGGAVYGGGYGYGAYAYPIVIETITTSGGGYSEEVTEEYVTVHHRARAHRRPRCTCAAPPRPAPARPAPRPRPRPPAGERG